MPPFFALPVFEFDQGDEHVLHRGGNLLGGPHGEALLRELRRHAQTRQLPVVVLTAAAEAARLAMLDCQGLLAKPINLDELRGLVSALLHEVTNDAV